MRINIIDNGSQYTHVIWRTIRDFDVDVKIISSNSDFQTATNADKIILSGGPGSAYTDEAKLSKQIIKSIFEKSISKPIFGICLGHQLIADVAGVKVDKGKSAEYGISKITKLLDDTILKDLPNEFNAWVSHFDEVKTLPSDFIRLAESQACEIEAMRHISLPIYSTQFHPEVWHTEHGDKILKNFIDL